MVVYAICMPPKKTPKKVIDTWEKRLRSEGLGLIEDVATKRTERARLMRGLHTPSGYTYTMQDREDERDMYARLFWDKRDELSATDALFCLAYGYGFSSKQFSEATGKSAYHVNKIKKRVTPLALNNFIKDDGK